MWRRLGVATWDPMKDWDNALGWSYRMIHGVWWNSTVNWTWLSWFLPKNVVHKQGCSIYIYIYMLIYIYICWLTVIRCCQSCNRKGAILFPFQCKYSPRTNHQSTGLLNTAQVVSESRGRDGPAQGEKKVTSFFHGVSSRCGTVIKRLGKMSIKNGTTKQSGDKCGYMQICVWCIIWIFLCGYNGNVNH